MSSLSGTPVLFSKSLRRQPPLSTCLSTRHLTIQMGKLNTQGQKTTKAAKSGGNHTFLYSLPPHRASIHPALLPEDLQHSIFPSTIWATPSLIAETFFVFTSLSVRFTPSLFHSQHLIALLISFSPSFSYFMFPVLCMSAFIYEEMRIMPPLFRVFTSGALLRW